MIEALSKIYCARGEMENRIKEQQLDLFADRTSCSKWWPNQFRLLLSSLAYLLLEALRRLGLKGAEPARLMARPSVSQISGSSSTISSSGFSGLGAAATSFMICAYRGGVSLSALFHNLLVSHFPRLGRLAIRV